MSVTDFGDNGWKVILMIANMLVNTGIVTIVLCMNKFDPCWICIVEERLTSVCYGVGMIRLWRQRLESYPYDSQYVGEHRHCDDCVVYE